MNLSYWEIKSWFDKIDICIIGSGIVGLHTALFLKNKYADAKIIILEKGNLPQGASTKNAGFACFGSLSEIVDDLQQHTEAEVQALVQKRWDGLSILRSLGDEQIGFKDYGGYELFLDMEKFNKYEQQIDQINALLAPIYKIPVFKSVRDPFGFDKIHGQLIHNRFEGQIDTGKMMMALIHKVQMAGITILNNCHVSQLNTLDMEVEIESSILNFKAKKVCITTNGFAKGFLDEDVKPARAQVLITKPIKNLKIKGTFHLDKGYYYFRNIDDRILLGGGRNLDFKTEETTQFGQTPLVQAKLESLLKEVISPNENIQIDQRWSGIMGVGHLKKPIIKKVKDHVYCGVRLGGMGVAIGAEIAKELAELVDLD